MTIGTPSVARIPYDSAHRRSSGANCGSSPPWVTTGVRSRTIRRFRGDNASLRICIAAPDGLPLKLAAISVKYSRFSSTRYTEHRVVSRTAMTSSETLINVSSISRELFTSLVTVLRAASSRFRRSSSASVSLNSSFKADSSSTFCRRVSSRSRNASFRRRVSINSSMSCSLVLSSSFIL